MLNNLYGIFTGATIRPALRRRIHLTLLLLHTVAKNHHSGKVLDYYLFSAQFSAILDLVFKIHPLVLSILGHLVSWQYIYIYCRQVLYPETGINYSIILLSTGHIFSCPTLF